MRSAILCSLLLDFLTSCAAAEEPVPQTDRNQLRRIENPKPLLADYPEYFEPIQEEAHFESPAIVNDEGADLHVRAWRFSSNARGIIEMPNHLRTAETAVIMVHPWATDNNATFDVLAHPSCLGIGSDRDFHDSTGRPYPVYRGQPIRELF